MDSLLAESLDTGITVSELTDRNHPIPISTNCVTAFVGRTRSGPVNRAIEITSTGEFVRVFGGAWSESLLPEAIEQYFRHGGKHATVVRVANGAAGAEIALPAAGGALVLVGVNPGSSERLRAAVDFDGIEPVESDLFNLTVQRLTGTDNRISDQEIFSRLSTNPDADNYVVDQLTRSSLVRVVGAYRGSRPAATGDHGRTDDASGYVIHRKPGSDGFALTDYDLIGSAEEGTGLFSLNAIEQLDFVYAPPGSPEMKHGPAFYAAAEKYCASRFCVLVVDPPAQYSQHNPGHRVPALNGLESAYVLTYYPRPLQRGAADPVPVGGALAGMLARETEAGTIAADFSDVVRGLAREYFLAGPLSEELEMACLRAGINALRPRADGRLTLMSSLTTARGLYDDVSSLQVSRLTMFIRRTLEANTRWVVFGAGGGRFWEPLATQVDAFLCELCAAGVLRDATAGGRNFVRCDAATNAHLDPKERAIHFLVGFTPAKLETPIVLSITQAAQCAKSVRV